MSAPASPRPAWYALERGGWRDYVTLLHPPYTRPAPRHHDVWRTPLDASYTALFNVLETPVTVVPIAWDAGLPVAVQVIAAPGRDHVSVRAAEALEEEFGGWRLATPAGARA